MESSLSVNGILFGAENKSGPKNILDFPRANDRSAKQAEHLQPGLSHLSQFHGKKMSAASKKSRSTRCWGCV
jgi:hypothetical protein